MKDSSSLVAQHTTTELRVIMSTVGSLVHRSRWIKRADIDETQDK